MGQHQPETTDSVHHMIDRLKRFMPWIKYVVMVLVVGFLILATRSAYDSWMQQKDVIEIQIQSLESSLASQTDPDIRDRLGLQLDLLRQQVPTLSNLHIGRLCWAGLFYAAGLFPAGMVLHTNCGLFGQRPKMATAIAAQLIGHLGKYVPGKAMVLVLRAGVLRRDGVSIKSASASIFAETFLMMAVGATIAGIITLVIPAPRWIFVASACMAVGTAIPTTLPIMRRLIEYLRRKEQMDAVTIGWKWSLTTWAWSLCSWILIGISFAFVVAAIPSNAPMPDLIQLFAISTAAISLGMVIGFASLIPGGAGVRELVLTTILGVAFDPPHGILAAIAARLVFVLAEMILGGLSWAWIQWSDRSRAVAA